MRLSEARREYFRRLAREEGYLSRAAYKLLQIDAKYRLLSPGSRVLDLGCAPGGWSQVACAAVGESGLVVGVDLSYMTFRGANYRFVKGDISTPETVQRILSFTPSFDCVLSDLSPKLMGVWDADSARQLSLASDALQLARKVLRAGGSSVFKAFQGESTNEFINDARASFERVVISKPAASRKQASEIYLVCLNFKGS